MTKSEAFKTLEKVLKYSQAGAVTANLSGGGYGSTRLADNVITQNVHCDDLSLRVECAYGQSHASATTSDLSAAALKAVVARAQELAKVSPPDPEYMPPVEAAEACKYTAVNAYFAPTVKLSPLAKARQLAAAVETTKAKNFRLSGAYGSGESFSAFANSAGLRAYHQETTAEIHATVLSSAGSGWAEALANDATGINAAEVAGKALAIAEAAQNPVVLEPGKYTVILSPAAAAEMLLFAFWNLDAKATDEGRTFLRGKLNTKICDEKISIRSDPADQRCPSEPFQHDGLVSPKLHWIEKGVVKNLFYSRYWAKKQGQAPVGWPSNLIMEGGSTSEKEMLASVSKGLLITRFWYIRFVDPMIPSVTGMTRDGLFLIENGKIARPVKNMRFNENIVDVLKRVEMLGPTERTLDLRILFPRLKVRDFNFTSATNF